MVGFIHLYKALSTKPDPVKKSLLLDVNSIEIFFEPDIDVFAWIQGALHLAHFCRDMDDTPTRMRDPTLATVILRVFLTVSSSLTVTGLWGNCSPWNRGRI